MADIGNIFHYLGLFIGRLIPTFILSRLIELSIRKWIGNPYKLVISNGGALVIMTILAGYGFIDDGPPVFWQALCVYFPPVIFWVVFDVIRWIRKANQK